MKGILLGTREDRTLDAFRSILDLSVVCYYDDLGSGWDFSYEDGQLTFYVGEEAISPAWIVDRGISGNSAPALAKLLLLALETWDGLVVSRPSAHFSNGSKPYQMVTTLKEAKAHLANSSVFLPDTYLLKTSDPEQFLPKGDYIVKSSSGVRSHVVGHNIYAQWDVAAVANLPTLFQEKLKGDDVRVHIAGTFVDARFLINKDNLDYRYGSQRPKFEQKNIAKDVTEFCRLVSKIENNRLMGLDFVLSEGKYYCLEANPGPGWSYFYDTDEECADLARAIQKLMVRNELET